LQKGLNDDVVALVASGIDIYIGVSRFYDHASNDQCNRAFYGELVRDNEFVKGRIRFLIRYSPNSAGRAWVNGNTAQTKDVVKDRMNNLPDTSWFDNHLQGYCLEDIIA